MELTEEQKNKMIDARLQQYAARRFDMLMDQAALLAAGDDAGVEATQKRIEAIDAAVEAVQKMRC
jgi:hypothetical protein